MEVSHERQVLQTVQTKTSGIFKCLLKRSSNMYPAMTLVVINLCFPSFFGTKGLLSDIVIR